MMLEAFVWIRVSSVVYFVAVINWVPQYVRIVVDLFSWQNLQPRSIKCCLLYRSPRNVLYSSFVSECLQAVSSQGQTFGFDSTRGSWLICSVGNTYTVSCTVVCLLSPRNVLYSVAAWGFL
jgi:hypothetical protein